MNHSLTSRLYSISTATESCEADNMKSKDVVNEFTYRSHNCGELRESDIGKEVTLCGWLEFSRMKRFFTLRDGYGHTQVLIPEHVSTFHFKLELFKPCCCAHVADSNVFSTFFYSWSMPSISNQ